MYKNIIYLLLVVLFVQTRSVGQEQDIYIKAGQFYDSKNNQLLKNKVIRVSGKTIESIKDFGKIPKNSEVVDLSDYTVLPGLIDAHTHVLFSQDANVDFSEHSVQSLTMESDGLRTLRGAKRAKSYLEVGITSIKDLGNSGLFLDVGLRDAINEGTIEGPRIFASGPIMAATGGQIYGVLPDHQDIIDLEYRIIKGVDDARNAVREHVNQNVDLIKICADNLPNNTRLTVDEIKTIVETAHSYGLTVTAHCVTDASARNAIAGGVDGIEHGFNIADSTLTLMAQNKVFLVPTENSSAYMDTYVQLAGYKKENTGWISKYMSNMKKRLMKALDEKVTVVAGSDNYTDIGTTRGESSRDMFRTYFEAGMKPLNILRSATYLSALSLHKEKEIGYLTEGAKADIIAVKGNLTSNFVQTMGNVVFVMKDGHVYLDKVP